MLVYYKGSCSYKLESKDGCARKENKKKLSNSNPLHKIDVLFTIGSGSSCHKWCNLGVRSNQKWSANNNTTYIQGK